MRDPLGRSRVLKFKLPNHGQICGPQVPWMMQLSKTLIFGNSGSGKSTLAKGLAKAKGLSHLDLDSLAWLPTSPPKRAPLEDSKVRIMEFISTNSSWVIEGCYSDLLAMAIDAASEIVFLDLSVEDCIENAKNRPWEPHKYDSKEAQDKNLRMLVSWIRQYADRVDVFSRQAHLELYDSFQGKKSILTSNTATSTAAKAAAA